MNDTDAIRKHLHALGDGPVIAIGDYNATWDQARFRGNPCATGTPTPVNRLVRASCRRTRPTARLGNRPVVAMTM